MLFDSAHITYIAVSLAVTAALLWWGSRLRSEAGKRRFLTVFGLGTFLLHISWLWYAFLKDGSASVPDNMLFPIYFCNLCMYTLCACCFVRATDTKFFELLATFTAYGGVFGALISLFYPDYYLNSGVMLEWGVFKSMLSHSTMLIGSLFLFVGGYVRISPRNILCFVAGELVAGGLGLGIIWLYRACGLTPPNAMYWLAPPVESAPWLTNWVIALAMTALVAGFTLIWERAARRRRHAPGV